MGALPKCLRPSSLSSSLTQITSHIVVAKDLYLISFSCRSCHYNLLFRLPCNSWFAQQNTEHCSWFSCIWALCPVTVTISLLLSTRLASKQDSLFYPLDTSLLSLQLGDVLKLDDAWIGWTHALCMQCFALLESSRLIFQLTFHKSQGETKVPNVVKSLTCVSIGSVNCVHFVRLYSSSISLIYFLCERNIPWLLLSTLIPRKYLNSPYPSSWILNSGILLLDLYSSCCFQLNSCHLHRQV